MNASPGLCGLASGHDGATMSPTRPSSRRSVPASSSPRESARDGRRPSTARIPAQGGKRAGAASPSARQLPAKSAAARPSSADAATAEAGAAGAGRRGAARRTQIERKPSKAPWIIGAVVVLAIAGAIAYGPVRRSMLLSTLDSAEGAAAIEAADQWFTFENRRESALRTLISSNRGPFAAQLYLAKSAQSLATIVALIERGDLTTEQLAETLNTGVEIFSNDRDAKVRQPRGLAEWAEKHEDRAVANAALALLVRFAAVDVDREKTSALLARIAADPAQDPLRSEAALNGLATLLNNATLGHALGLLRGSAVDLVLAHEGLLAAIRSNVRAGHIVELMGLLDNEHEGVRALALACMARITLPESTDPALRRDLGARVAAKLVASTPAKELAAALLAVKNLRLVGASDAVLALAAQRETLALPGIDDSFWIFCLGEAFILTKPESARITSEAIIARLAESVNDPALRPIAAGALGLIRDPGFLSLRPGMDALAAHLDDPVCFTALTTLVGKTYGRDDVLKACGDDPQRWAAFLAQDRPRFLRLAEMRTFVDANRSTQRISDGKAKLGVIKDFLDKAREELQGWLDAKDFVAPLGLTRNQVDGIFKSVQELNVSVRKAYSGAVAE